MSVITWPQRHWWRLRGAIRTGCMHYSKLLLQNEVGQVLSILQCQLEPAEQKEAPIRSAHGYMSQRQDHMDYAGARATGLPIGSGEVESGHKHVLQKRL